MTTGIPYFVSSHSKGQLGQLPLLLAKTDSLWKDGFCWKHIKDSDVPSVPCAWQAIAGLDSNELSAEGYRCMTRLKAEFFHCRLEDYPRLLM